MSYKRRKTEKFMNTRKLETLLNNQWIKVENGNKKSLDKQNWKHNIPKPMNVAKTVLREKFIPANAYIKEQGRSQIT